MGKPPRPANSRLSSCEALRRTRTTDPQRAARLWWAVTLVFLWLLDVGGLAEEKKPKSTL